MRRLAIFLVTAFALGIAAVSPALAQKTGASASEPYKPDIAVFKGGDSIVLAPNRSLMLSGDGTIEFWVAPAWKKDPGYDPVVISNAGPDGASYSSPFSAAATASASAPAIRKDTRRSNSPTGSSITWLSSPKKD